MIERQQTDKGGEEAVRTMGTVLKEYAVRLKSYDACEDGDRKEG